MNKMSFKDWTGLLMTVGLLAVLLMIIANSRPAGITIVNPSLAAVSVILLLAGMAGQYMVWHASVGMLCGNVTGTMTFRSHALSIWGKYVPGKIWAVVGRATILGHQSGLSVPRLLAASSFAQACMIIAGVAVAVPILLWSSAVARIGSLGLITLAVLAVVSVVIVPGILLRTRIGNRFAGQHLWIQAMRPAFLALATWVLWGLGFHYLLETAGYQGIVLNNIAAFAAGATTGMLALIVPGGLGVREGAIAAVLHEGGIELGAAAMLALSARLWFVLGEGVVFIVGLQSTRISRRNDCSG